MLLSAYSLGSLVTVNASFMGEPAGVVAYVYQHYWTTGKEQAEQGISLLTQNGKDLGGFSLAEQHEYLSYYGDTGQVYVFVNQVRFCQDIQRGLFKHVFDNLESFHKTLKIK